MTEHWSTYDPGAGDMTACLNAAKWCEQEATELEAIEATATAILADLDAAWAGFAAMEFRLNVTELKTNALKHIDTMQAASKIFKKYADTVDDIARRAKPYVSDLESAQAVLTRTYDESPVSQAVYEARSAEYAQSLTAADAALLVLARLSNERQDADTSLATQLTVEASEAWGLLPREIAAPDGTLRDRANSRVWDLIEDFRTGAGPAGLALGAGDPFVDKLRHSEHIAKVREQIRSELGVDPTIPYGEVDVDGDGVRDSVFEPRSISNNPFVLLQDGINLSTSGMTGSWPAQWWPDQNLPESCLGSYSLNVFVSEPDASGGVTVTYVVNNDTTIDSATRIPGTARGEVENEHLPFAFSGMENGNAKDGTWSSQHQTITWSERLVP